MNVEQIKKMMSEISACIADPMGADHAEVSKASLERWHKTLNESLLKTPQMKDAEDAALQSPSHPTDAAAPAQSEEPVTTPISVADVKNAFRKVGIKVSQTHPEWLEYPIEHSAGIVCLSDVAKAFDALLKVKS